MQFYRTQRWFAILNMDISYRNDYRSIALDKELVRFENIFKILFIYHNQVEFMIMHDEKTFCMNVFLRSNTSLRLREFAKIFYTKRKKRERDSTLYVILNQNLKKRTDSDLRRER